MVLNHIVDQLKDHFKAGMNYAFVYGSFAGADRVSRIRLRRYSTRFDFDCSSERARATNEYFPSLRRKIAIERETIFRPRWRSMKISRGNFSCTGREEEKKEKEKEKRASIEIKRKNVIERFVFLTLLGEMECIDSIWLGFE